MDGSTSGLTRLEELMVNDDEVAMEDDERQSVQDDSESFLADESPLAETDLGRAIDTLITTWTQLLPNMRIRQTSQPPTQDHTKELAEICVKNFRDACHEANSEFTRIALQWQHENPDEYHEEQLKNVEEASARQSTLLGRVPGVWSRRTDDYFKNAQ